MSRAIKNKRNIAALCIAAGAGLLLAALGFLWLFLADEDNIRFHMPGGEHISLEYGESYADDVSAYALIPLVDKELSLDCFSPTIPDTHTLGRYVITYTASFLGRSHSAERIIDVIDSTAPEISLTADSAYEADWLEGYVEEGYSAFDLCDGDLTDKVEIKRGDGFVEYSVSDSSGNKSTVRREIDYRKNLPTITLSGGDLVISPRPFYSEPGFTALDGQGADCSAQLTVEGNVDSRKAGEYTISYVLANLCGDTVRVSRNVTVLCESCPEICTPEEKTIYLTFDDGPGPYTDMLLDLLDAYDVKASFFVTGNGGRYNTCIKRAYEAGHSIGVHSYGHNYGYIYSSEENFYTDFNAAQQLIYDQTGSYTQLYRFPGGSSNTVSRFNYGIMSRLSTELEDMGYRYFDWNVDSGDASYARNSAAVAANIINGCARRHCSVVLQHDIKLHSVYAVESVIQWGLENGYSFKALELSSPSAHQGIAN